MWELVKKCFSNGMLFEVKRYATHENFLRLTPEYPSNLAMISIVQPKNSAAIWKMLENGFAYKLKWDFHDVSSELPPPSSFVALIFYFLLFAECVCVCDARRHFILFKARDKSDNNHNMALKQCFVFETTPIKKRIIFFCGLPLHVKCSK